MKKTKVILVDNNEIFRNALEETLLEIGKNKVEIVASISNGFDFLEELNRHPKTELVFMDINMPLMNGIEATTKAVEKYPKIIIIGFSASDNPLYVRLMIKAGAKGYLSKNYNNYEIIKQAVFNRHEQLFFSNNIDIRVINDILNISSIQQSNKFRTMEKKRILLVDDDPDIILTLKSILEKEGYEIQSANNKKEGLAKVSTIKPDMIILDVMMTTHHEGFEMNKELRQNPEYRNIPILMLTSIDVLITSNADIQGMAREYRKDPSHKELNVLLIKDNVTGEAGIDYKSDEGKSVWVPVDGFLRKPVEAGKIIPQVQKILNQ